MNIKKFIFRFLLLALLFFFTINLLPIARITPSLFTWIWIAGGIALANLFIKNLLRFLTVKTSFITIFIATIIVTTLMLYFLDLFIPGFDVNPGVIGPFNLNIVTINSFPVNEITSKVFVAAVYAMFVAIMDILNSRDED